MSEYISRNQTTRRRLEKEVQDRNLRFNNLDKLSKIKKN